MLILRHKNDDEITLMLDGREILLRIKKIHKGSVEIGYLAPREVEIKRIDPEEEIVDKS